mmetsp:Transcript_75906/g.235011  ORF Transcript_75906/g.235011 Transcript_75906/m.235011 type:complete len:526 (-) Transcript_75906:53-1630(-)
MTFVRTLRTELLNGQGGAVPQMHGGYGGMPVYSQEAAGIAEEIMLFRQMFPFDEDAYNYLMNSQPAVQQAVLQNFKPKSEGEGDYSALVITFTKKCRQAMQQQNMPKPQMYQPPVLERPPQLYQQQPPPQQVYQPPHQRNAQPMAGMGADDPLQMQAGLMAFRERYPFDEDAWNYLMNSPPEVQRQVMQDFKPKQEGEADYSALVITFAKRCRGAMAAAQASVAPFRGATGPVLASRAAPGAPPGSGPTLAEYDAFRARYPHDEAAHNYLMNSSPDVQVQALRTFRPPREGEADYSALFITYTKRCRLSAQSAAPRPPIFRGGCGGNGAVRYAPPGGYAPPQQQQYAQPQQYAGAAADLDGFRLRYPMDDRAFGYVLESSPEVQRQVVETFVPKRADDTDFSAPIVAYAKLCRARCTEAASFGVNPIAAAPAAAASYPLAATNDPTLAPELSFFCQRYPMDERAQTFLYESPLEVIDRVLREFRPQREGDSDYSAAIVYFVGQCRREAGVDGSAGAAMKRARFAY